MPWSSARMSMVRSWRRARMSDVVHIGGMGWLVMDGMDGWGGGWLGW
jgi:hypothetical protein